MKKPKKKSINLRIISKEELIKRRCSAYKKLAE